MAKNVLGADAKRWRAESDADTMARYEEIMQDAARRKAAVNAAKSRAADLSKRAGIMGRVANAGSRTTKPASKKK